MEIVPNPYLAALLAIPFVVSFLALRFILFKPLLDYLDERDETSAMANRDADQLSAKLQEQMEHLEEMLTGARAEAANLRAKARTVATEKEGEIIKQARLEAAEELRKAKEVIKTDSKAASLALKETAKTLSVEMAQRVLGRGAVA
ncbi:MAG: ATP synthase F0 subunit B [Proteobacteria bacterium]|jgi:F-type H+-transporting ATPase subunit b|nr:ATP synthase F0 subunit B [Pseudomonadota bacterium]